MIKLMFIAAMLLGCSTIDMHTPPPEHWPVLEERIERGGFFELQERCKNPWPVLIVAVFACAIPDLVALICLIFALEDDDSHLPHERLHCRGYDHPGGTSLREYYERWMAWRKGK
jgi:hypothetical protein